ncbi:MAG: hypothetical protein WC880_02955 [Candidatus Paceibacterota bacterium]
MEDEDRTWRLQGLLGSRIRIVVEKMDTAMKERNARVSSQGFFSALMVDILAPFQFRLVGKRMKKAGRRTALNFQKKHDLTGYEMWKMENGLDS